jgi:predicted membrane chloride channel (bestrophin family)
MVLQPHEVELLLQQPHVGTAVLQQMGALMAASSMREVQKLRIDENITVLQDTMGGCERWVGLAVRGVSREGRLSAIDGAACAAACARVSVGCRLFSTPIPLFYTRHTSRYLICW